MVFDTFNENNEVSRAAIDTTLSTRQSPAAANVPVSRESSFSSAVGETFQRYLPPNAYVPLDTSGPTNRCSFT